MKPSAQTTRNLAYAGFIIASCIALVAVSYNRDLTGAALLCGTFMLPLGVHGARRAFGTPQDREDR